MNYLVSSGTGGCGGSTVRNNVITVGIVLVRHIAGHRTVSFKTALTLTSHATVSVRSIALTVTLQADDRTLTEAEIEAVSAAILTQVKKVGAVLR